MYEIARLRIALSDMPRPVLRRLEVPLAIHLDDLHIVLQHGMGWENRHPYEFRAGSASYGESNPKARVNPRQDASEATLGDICHHLGGTQTFEYIYDFRDRWVHRVRLQGVGEIEPGRKYPHLLHAIRRCPPEDCGGPWGYQRYLETVAPEGVAMQRADRPEWEDDFNPNTVDDKMIRIHFDHLADVFAARQSRRRR